jgi:hypothetical protein
LDSRIDSRFRDSRFESKLVRTNSSPEHDVEKLPGGDARVLTVRVLDEEGLQLAGLMLISSPRLLNRWPTNPSGSFTEI